MTRKCVHDEIARAGTKDGDALVDIQLRPDMDIARNREGDRVATTGVADFPPQ